MRRSAEEVREAGVDLLDPIALAAFRKNSERKKSRLLPLAIDLGVRHWLNCWACCMPTRPTLSGTLTVAFAAQQWTGGRGLDRLLNELHPDEMIYVGR